MKRLGITLLAVVLVSAPTWAGSPRTLDGTVDATGVEKVHQLVDSDGLLRCSGGAGAGPGE